MGWSDSPQGTQQADKMSEIEEEWRPVKDWPNYEVSNLGRLRRTTVRITMIARRRLPSGYLGSAMWKGKRHNRESKTATIHVLVADAFIGPRPKGFHTHHKNRDREDARAINLEYIPGTVHLSMHAKSDTRKKADFFRRDMIVKCKAIGLSNSQILRIFDTSPSSIMKMFASARKRGLLPEKLKYVSAKELTKTPT